jgi:hypothetical protein
VFRLIRWLFSLALMAAFIWFATMVPLGKRTLWRHLLAIFSTQEAKDLVDGTKEEASKVAARLHQEAHDLGAARHAPLDPVDERDRKGLDHLVQEKTHKK